MANKCFLFGLSALLAVAVCAQAAPKFMDYPLPVPGGEHVFPVTKLRPAQGAAVEAGDFVFTKGRVLNWFVEGVPEGEYYLRLVIGKTGDDLVAAGSGPLLYLNGVPLHFGGVTGLVFHQRLWFGVLQSSGPVLLKPGDCLRLNGSRSCAYGALSLGKAKLDDVVSPVRDFADPFCRDRVRLNGSFDLGAGVFKAELVNMVGRGGKFTVDCRVQDYFQNVVASETKELAIPYGGAATLELPFKVGGSDRYLATVEAVDFDGVKTEAKFESLAAKTTGVRRKLWLVDGWDCAVLKDAGPGSRTLERLPDADATHRTVSLPCNFNNIAKDCHIAWFTKAFDLPAAWDGKRVYVHIDRALYESVLLVNGRRAAGKRLADGVGPFGIDVTGLLKPGARNELSVGLLDRAALFYDEDLKKDILPEPRAGMKLRAYVGMHPGLGEVWLEALPQTHARDVFVKTSFREKTIAAEFKAGPEAKTVSGRALRQGVELFRFQDATVQPGVTTLSGVWAAPPLWGPVEFPLLDLELTLKDAAGRVLDVSDTRFGFRELWADGMELKWNGKTVKFGSRPFLSSWGHDATRAKVRETVRMALEGGCRMLRHIYNANEYPDIADEEGMVMALSPGMSPAGLSVQDVANDEFWDNIHAVCAGGILGMRNHPSVFTWYLSNECMAQSEKPQRDRLRAQGEKLLKLDGTRFMEFGCDIDLRGFTDLISTHYPVDKDICRVDRAWLPEAAYWRRLGQNFEKGMMVPGGQLKGVANVSGESPIMWGVKPIIVNECCWISFFNPPNGLTKIDGDQVYTGLAGLLNAHRDVNTLAVQGHRDAGVSAITLWTHVGSDPNQYSLPDVDIVILQKIDKYFSGAEAAYDVNIFHDLFQKSDLDFRWQLKDKGKVAASGAERFTADFCSMFRRRLDFRLPPVAAKTVMELELSLDSGGKALCRRTMPITVYPRPLGKIPAGVKTVVYDPVGTSAVELASVFSGMERVGVLNAENLAGARLLVVGRDLPEAQAKAVSTLVGQFAAGGGTVLALNQGNVRPLFPFAPGTTELNASKCFTFRADHPLLEGLDAADLSYWAPDHRTASRCYKKPTNGNFRVVVEAGGNNGLDYAALWDAQVGKGSVVFCQLALDANLALNPAALKLWENIFKYAASARSELKPLGYLGGDGFKATLVSLGVDFKDVTSTAALAGCAALVVDLSTPLPADKATLARNYLEAGGQVLLHGLTEGGLAAAAVVAGASVTLDPNIPQSWRGRLVWRGSDPLSAGLTNFDFFWKKSQDTEAMWPLFLSESENFAQPGSARIACGGAEPLCYPEFLLRKPSGRGTLYLDTLNLAEMPQASRAFFTLLTNLGVRIATAAGQRDYFGGMAFEPLDMAKLMNRAFADKVASDGKGGWHKGPDIDLANFSFPAGVHVFKNVPFQVCRPLGCMVLASKFRPAGPPESIEIAVGRRCDALYFLQTCGWVSQGRHASYVVNYADGSSHAIKLVGGVNLRDWGSGDPGAPFVGETETLSQLAVSVKQRTRQGRASLYQMAWLNPFPEKLVKSIIFKSANNGLPILVALTTGTRKAATAVKFNPETARKLVAQGCLLQAQQKWTEAIPVFREALETYPQGLEPYLQIGRCHEALGDWESAVKVYRETLKVDINQPLAMTALENAKKKLEELKK